jgi:hypothetical protein
VGIACTLRLQRLESNCYTPQVSPSSITVSKTSVGVSVLGSYLLGCLNLDCQYLPYLRLYGQGPAGLQEIDQALTIKQAIIAFWPQTVPGLRAFNGVWEEDGFDRTVYY